MSTIVLPFGEEVGGFQLTGAFRFLGDGGGVAGPSYVGNGEHGERIVGAGDESCGDKLVFEGQGLARGRADLGGVGDCPIGPLETVFRDAEFVGVRLPPVKCDGGQTEAFHRKGSGDARHVAPGRGGDRAPLREEPGSCYSSDVDEVVGASLEVRERAVHIRHDVAVFAEVVVLVDNLDIVLVNALRVGVGGFVADGHLVGRHFFHAQEFDGAGRCRQKEEASEEISSQYENRINMICIGIRPTRYVRKSLSIEM